MKYQSYVEVLIDRQDRFGSDSAFKYLENGEVDGPIIELSYGSLGDRAKAIAAALCDSGLAGRRVIMLYPPGVEFVAAFFGCLLAGSVAVPMPIPLPHEFDRGLRRLRDVGLDAGAGAVLATRMVIDGLTATEVGVPGLSDLPWIATDEISSSGAGDWRPARIRIGDPAFLQYTSGSTSAPRGVVVTHGNLLHNQHAIAKVLGHREDPRLWQGNKVVSWLPVYHDMGLIGPILQTVYIGGGAILMSPLDFLQRPERWLKALSHSGAHTSGGPNFGYELCIKRATPELVESLDLSKWRVAFNGAEPIHAATLRRFAETFEPAGFRPEALTPLYGLAESTLLVSGGSFDAVSRVIDRFEGQAGAERVSCGRPGPGITVRIVDPELCKQCPDGDIGEIWVAGESVAAGYLNNQSATQETFGARLSDGSGPYLRTGDLGFIDQGELFITGRIKDLLVIDGKNHFPHDIELSVEKCDPRVRPGCVAVFSVDGDRGEEAVVVTEAKSTDAEELATLVAKIRAAVSSSHGLRLRDVVPIMPRTIPKTSSGKIQRQACRAAYLAGELKPIEAGAPRGVEGVGMVTSPGEQAASPELPKKTAEEVREWLVDAIGERAGVEPADVDPDQPLAELGLGSRGLVELTLELESFSGKKLPPSFFFDFPTVAGASEEVGRA